MRLASLAISGLSIALILILPVSALGQDNQNYFTVKGGFYSPKGDLDDSGYHTGLNGEIAFGRYLYESLALELGLGYAESEASITGTDAVLGSFTEEPDTKIIPLTLTAKGISRFEILELFGEVGIGIYYADFEADFTSTALGSFVMDDDDVAFGIYFGFGGRYYFYNNVFLGVELRILTTTDAEFEGSVSGVRVERKFDLDGLHVTGNLGFRF